MAAELLHGEERVFHGDAGCQGLEKREERAGGDVECGIAMRPGQPPTAGDGSRAILDGLERAKAHRRAKVEHPFPVIKQQFGLEKTRLPGQATNRSFHT